MGIGKLLSVAIFLATPLLVNAQAPAFTQVIVFGDSLSDDGNIAHRARNSVGFSYPSSNFNYSDYRFTDDPTPRPQQICIAGPGTNNWKKHFSVYQSQKTVSMAGPIMHRRRYDQERHAGAHRY